MKNVRLTGIALAMAAALASGAAGAAPTSTMAVTAAITADCAIAQNAPIAFGNLDMLGSGVQSTAENIGTGSFNAICTNGTTNPKFKYTSQNSAAGAFRLVGADATTYIVYSVHQGASTAAGTEVAYDTAETHAAFAADGTSQTLTVKAKILPADKNGKLVQAYSDVITVTATFDA